MIVKTYKLGNSVIEIQDSSCVRTQDEIEAILAEIALFVADRLRKGVIQGAG
jgi:hypothetical protein